ncbi:hypothetical protein R1sor_006518 [Riccia sorocarpa]|uniref:Uncharacterized protein n=1 Tax=Riccia sorocarpa TaxID=122646 RepID=A0ABD3HMV9_9MARC
MTLFDTDLTFMVVIVGEGKEKRKSKDCEKPSTSKKRKKNELDEEETLSIDLDEGDVNVDEMLNKILKEKAKIDTQRGVLNFTDKELKSIGANNLDYLKYCFPLRLSKIVQVLVTKILPPTPGCRPFNQSHMWEILLSLRTNTAVSPQDTDLLPARVLKMIGAIGNNLASETKL